MYYPKDRWNFKALVNLPAELVSGSELTLAGCMHLVWWRHSLSMTTLFNNFIRVLDTLQIAFCELQNA